MSSAVTPTSAGAAHEPSRWDRRAALFPSLRATVVEVIRLAADPNSSVEELLRVVSGDPGLSIQVLRFANSAAFSPETEITTVARALSAIGSRALRNIAICIAACDSTPQDATGGLDFPGFLEDSLRRGAAAELLAAAIGRPDPAEAFTAGLLQDFGVVALAMHEPSRAAAWSEMRRHPHTSRREFERAIYGLTHDELAAELATRWKLPESLRAVMLHHQQPEDASSTVHERLVSICNTAEELADVFVCSHKDQALIAVKRRLETEWGLSEARSDQLLGELPQRVELYADAMGISVPQQVTLEQLVEDIRAHNRLLAEMNLEFLHETNLLARLLEEKDRTERELRIAKARLERLATTDALTGLPNRRHFEVSLERELERMVLSGQPLSVILCDIDHFKKLNDTYGHPFGDRVLRIVSKALRATVRVTDLVARVGGEEFAVIVPTASRRDGVAVGERLRRAIEELSLSCGEHPIRVTMSLGGATLLRVPDDASLGKTAYVTVSEADQALYNAKRSGRNRVAWRPKPVDVNAACTLADGDDGDRPRLADVSSEVRVA